MAAAVPLIATGVSAYMSHRAQSQAGKRSREEQRSLLGAQGAGGALQRMGQGAYRTGQSLIGQGEETLAGPSSYYSRLLGGNRALASQAVAGPRAAISDVYRGAERGLEQGGVRGAERDVARGELGRQRAGQISSLLTGVQPGAAGALTGIGGEQLSGGLGALGTGMQGISGAGNIFSGLLGQGAANRRYAREEGQGAGQAWGGLIFDLLRQYGGGGGYGQNSRSAPNRSWIPEHAPNRSWIPGYEG